MSKKYEDIFHHSILVNFKIEWDVKLGELTYNSFYGKFPQLEEEVIYNYYIVLSLLEKDVLSKDNLLKLFISKYDGITFEEAHRMKREKWGVDYFDTLAYNNFVKNNPDTVALVKNQMKKILDDIYKNSLTNIKTINIFDEKRFSFNIDEGAGTCKIVYKLK